MDKNRIRGRPDLTSELMIAKSTAIRACGEGGRSYLGRSLTCPGYRTEQTRMSGGVGGGGREADPYPDCHSRRAVTR
jgi:hypothetical protein